MIALRVFNVSGPYMTKPTSYALGDLGLQALFGAEMTIHSARPVFRSYVDARDLGAVAIDVLATGEVDRVIMDAAGPEVIEVGELADRLRHAAQRPDLPIRRSPVAGAEDRYVGDLFEFAVLAHTAGVALRSLDEQLAVTLADLRLRRSLESA